MVTAEEAEDVTGIYNHVPITLSFVVLYKPLHKRHLVQLFELHRYAMFGIISSQI